MSLTIDSIRTNKKKIEELIHFFSNSIENNKCKEEIISVFHKISFYTHDFFINEELFMKKYDMPLLSDHVKEHLEFANRMQQFQKDFEQGKAKLCVELLSYLKLWYEKHILNSDEKIISYLENRN